MLINLHSHLEGRVRPSTAAELAESLGLLQPDQGWEAALQLASPADLTVYLECVAASYPLFGDADSLARITREAVEDAAADGQDYLELRFGPATHVRDGFDIDEVIRAACRGLAEGVESSGMPAGLVVATLRHYAPEDHLTVARAASRFAGEGVVGFDLAGDELKYPALTSYADAFALARSSGLGVTCHAAEAAGGWAAREAAETLGVRRIGHGAHVASDPSVLAWAADNGIVIEVCPTSNWFTGAISTIDAHPAPVFKAAGISVVLGDDNPVQIGSALAHERSILGASLGFDHHDLAEVDRASVEFGFMAESTRNELAARLRL